MNFFAVFLRKIEPSCEIGAYSAAIFRKVPYRKWPPLALSWSVFCAIRGYYVYRGVEPQYWRRDRVLRRGRELPSQESCNLTSNDISKRNIASELRQVQVPLSSTAPEVYIAIKQYPGVLPLPKLEVLSNFSRPINRIFRACRGKIAASLRTLDFRTFRIFTVSQLHSM